MANTMRVDLCYRPLRIGWAVRAGDFDAIRQAMKYSHSLWGGRFNPIIVIDREEEAHQLVERFRLDLIWPLGDSQEVKDFPKKFPHLIPPFFGEIFVKDSRYKKHFSQVLDISNAFSYWHTRPEWKYLKEDGIRSYEWQEDDPLSDVFLIQFGAYPSPDEVGLDYLEMLHQYVTPQTYKLDVNERIPADITDCACLATPSRYGFERHYTVRAGWDSPGFFVGSASDPDDLICHWNLRACDIPIWFVDLNHIDRYAELIPEWESTQRSMVEHRLHESDRLLGVWTRSYIDEATKLFEKNQPNLYRIEDGFWSGRTVVPPMMYLGAASTLGVMGESNGVPRVNFALANKPFDDNPHFHHQHLVASISFIIPLFRDEQHTYDVPYIPKLNEFYARTMHFQRNKFRIEPERLGLVIEISDHDSFLTAMPVGDLIKHIFLMAGFDSKLSNSGRIVRQILTQLGGLQGARVFKVPGARELLKKFGPRETFTRETAITTIADKRPGGTASISEHTGLYLEPRKIGTNLTPSEVFTYMVDKGLFRIGVDLDCTKCGMLSWIAVDGLKQHVTCELCGHNYDTTRQLLDSKWRFRRSGVLGAERNAQGAVPVALTLQQLDTTLDAIMDHCCYTPSLDLTPTLGQGHPKCEVDFVWLLNGTYPGRSSLILAECKDKGPIKPEEFQRDVNNMRVVADAFSEHHLDTYILFVKMADFTVDEITMARALNGPYQQRVILLTPRELEPYHIYERLPDDWGIKSYANSPSELARVTTQIYFTEPVEGALDEDMGSKAVEAEILDAPLPNVLAEAQTKDV